MKIFVTMTGMMTAALAAIPPAQAEPAPAAPAVPAEFAARCQAINNLNIETVADTPGVIVSTAVVAGRVASPQERMMFVRRSHSQGNPMQEIPAYPTHCKVEGYITPAVKFSLSLPLSDAWNGRFMLAACDAWCGKVGEDIVVPGLHGGYATLTNDGGHYGRAPFDGVWAHNNQQARVDFAYRANHVSAQAAKAIISEFYGKGPHHSYIAGFSKGGNAGLMTVQRYPEDFDGVFVKAPVVHYNPKNAAHFPWLALAVYPDGKSPVMAADKIPLIHRSVTQACDALDGARDGVIDDPRQCRYDPAILLCKAGQSEGKNECLNDAQVAALRKIYAKPKNERGEIYFDYPVDIGSEMDWAGSILPPPGPAVPGIPFALTGAATGLRYMAVKDNPGPGYDWTRFDYVKEQARIDEMSRTLDPDAVDLSAFRARGGKMIIVHGWGDAMVSAAMTIDWFAQVNKKMGAGTVADFAQLYVIPGMAHGSGGTGPFVFDAQTALVRWVEQGVAPSQLMMSDMPGTTPMRQRAFYPWPALSRYKGKGDLGAAESYRRTAP